uniref:Uncharacterized protein n=1 Tax=Arundo donax TaxID=35708 RepID=A0A0A9FEA9_ARUDO
MPKYNFRVSIATLFSPAECSTRNKAGERLFAYTCK